MLVFDGLRNGSFMMLAKRGKDELFGLNGTAYQLDIRLKVVRGHLPNHC